MSYRLASAILKGAWLLHPAAAQAHLPLIASILKGEQPVFPVMSEERKADLQSYEVSAAAGDSGLPTDQKIVRVIPIVGELLKYTEDCGPVGMTEMTRWIQSAAEDSKVSAIVLKMDSPGGQVDGVQTLVDAILKARERKPVVAFIDDGMCCSGGYWVASATDEIIASQKTDWIGSIGVYVTLADMKAYYEAQGLPIHQIYADQSSEKNKIVIDALANDYEPIKKELLNPLAKTFISAVKKNRGSKLNADAGDPFKGRAYMADEAVSLGLIDKIGTFDYAVKRAADMSRASDNSKQKITTENNMKKKLHALAVLMGFAQALASAETDTPDITEESLDQMHAKFENTSAALETANTIAADLQTQLTAANDKLTASEKEVTELKAEVAKLGKLGGATHTNPGKEGSDDLGEPKQTAGFDPNAEHNRYADEMASKYQ